MEGVEQRILIKYNRPVKETLAIFAKNGLTTQQVDKEFFCGNSNIRRLARKHKETLRQRGFADHDIVKMAANDGGTQTIQYVIKNQSIIFASNLSCSDIATKCNANSGHARLEAFLSRKASVDA